MVQEGCPNRHNDQRSETTREAGYYPVWDDDEIVHRPQCPKCQVEWTEGRWIYNFSNGYRLSAPLLTNEEKAHAVVVAAELAALQAANNANSYASDE
jgi:hypothetical protein